MVEKVTDARGRDWILDGPAWLGLNLLAFFAQGCSNFLLVGLGSVRVFPRDKSYRCGTVSELHGVQKGSYSHSIFRGQVASYETAELLL
jgi:hypothetical protein